jgi:hypothetical protein
VKTRSPQTTAAGFDALGGGLVWIARLDAAVSSNASSGVSTTTPSARIHQLMPRSFSPARTPDGALTPTRRSALDDHGPRQLPDRAGDRRRIARVLDCHQVPWNRATDAAGNAPTPRRRRDLGHYRGPVPDARRARDRPVGATICIALPALVYVFLSGAWLLMWARRDLTGPTL